MLRHNAKPLSDILRSSGHQLHQPSCTDRALDTGVEFTFPARDSQHHFRRHIQIELYRGMQRIVGGRNRDATLCNAFADHDREVRSPDVDRGLTQQRRILGHQLSGQMCPEAFGGVQFP